MKSRRASLTALAFLVGVASCTHSSVTREGAGDFFANAPDFRAQPQLASRSSRSPDPVPDPVPEFDPQTTDLDVTAIEAAVDASLAPLSDRAPVRLTPAYVPAPVPSTPQQICWATEQTPAVYEQVMGEVQVVQAEIAPDGTVLRAPIYRRAPVPRVVRPRAELSFEAPCPDQLTPEFVSSLQRALGARGYFAGNVTGQMDAPTAAALRKYQDERGLKSAQLSLETARSLGLIAVTTEAAGG